MIRGAKKLIFILLCVFGVLIAFDAAAGGNLLHEIIQHIGTFLHHAQVHGPHFRNPVGH